MEIVTTIFYTLHLNQTYKIRAVFFNLFEVAEPKMTSKNFTEPQHF
jgi:hypothetical protein